MRSERGDSLEAIGRWDALKRVWLRQYILNLSQRTNFINVISSFQSVQIPEAPGNSMSIPGAEMDE
jgi:hypothetical protein